MIQIILKNKDEVLNKHFSSISNDWVIPVIDFYIMLFNAINSSSYLIGNQLPIHHNTAISIVEDFIQNKKNKKNIHKKDILYFLQGKDKSLISIKGRKLALKQYLEVLDYIKSNLKNILIGIPDSLLTHHNYINSKITLNITPKFKIILDKIFNYKKLIDGEGFKISKGNNWDSYALTKSIDLQVCPYCNRNWIITVREGNYIDKNGKKRDKVVNPQIDHFFCKSKFPLLQLSFYNLIPSCETCNSRLKGAIEFSLGSHLHPYLEGYSNNAKFKAFSQNYNSSIGLESEYEIILEKKLTSDIVTRINKNHTLFEIQSLYNKHGDIIAELFRKKHISNDKYIEILKNTYPALKNISYQELYKLAFGNYYNEEDYTKRPFAKLTRDICEQLELIK